MDLQVGDQVTISLRSDPRCLCLVRALVRSFGEAAGFDESRTHAIVLAVDEGCANIIRHSYAGRDDGAVEITCGIAEREGVPTLFVLLRDQGLTPDPQRIHRGVQVDTSKPGGLGLHFMRGVMDSVEFRPDPAGGNLLELLVACPRSASE